MLSEIAYSTRFCVPHGTTFCLYSIVRSCVCVSYLFYDTIMLRVEMFLLYIYSVFYKSNIKTIISFIARESSFSNAENFCINLFVFCSRRANLIKKIQKPISMRQNSLIYNVLNRVLVGNILDVQKRRFN